MVENIIAPIQTVTFAMSGSYSTFMEDLRRALAGVKPKRTKIAPPSSKIERPVLDEPTAPDKQPPRWIHIVLSGEKGVAPNVAIRSDDAYIVGFTNSQGTWFQLSKTGTKEKLVSENPVMTGFDGNYNTLIPRSKDGSREGGVKDLKYLNLSKSSTANAAGKLWNYMRKLNDDDDDDDVATILRNDELKKAVATLCVVLCEAARFTPVSDVINKGWANPRVNITDTEIGYIKEWGDLSEQLLEWKKAGFKGDAGLFKKFSGIGIYNGEQALAAVQLVKIIKRKNKLLAWLKYFWGLLVKKLQLQHEDTSAGYEKPPKGCSAAVNPL